MHKTLFQNLAKTLKITTLSLTLLTLSQGLFVSKSNAQIVTGPWIQRDESYMYGFDSLYLHRDSLYKYLRSLEGTGIQIVQTENGQVISATGEQLSCYETQQISVGYYNSIGDWIHDHYENLVVDTCNPCISVVQIPVFEEEIQAQIDGKDTARAWYRHVSNKSMSLSNPNIDTTLDTSKYLYIPRSYLQSVLFPFSGFPDSYRSYNDSLDIPYTYIQDWLNGKNLPPDYPYTGDRALNCVAIRLIDTSFSIGSLPYPFTGVVTYSTKKARVYAYDIYPNNYSLNVLYSTRGYWGSICTKDSLIIDSIETQPFGEVFIDTVIIQVPYSPSEEDTGCITTSKTATKWKYVETLVFVADTCTANYLIELIKKYCCDKIKPGIIAPDTSITIDDPPELIDSCLAQREFTLIGYDTLRSYTSIGNGSAGEQCDTNYYETYTTAIDSTILFIKWKELNNYLKANGISSSVETYWGTPGQDTYVLNPRVSSDPNDPYNGMWYYLDWDDFFAIVPGGTAPAGYNKDPHLNSIYIPHLTMTRILDNLRQNDPDYETTHLEHFSSSTSGRTLLSRRPADFETGYLNGRYEIDLINCTTTGLSKKLYDMRTNKKEFKFKYILDTCRTHCYEYDTVYYYRTEIGEIELDEVYRTEPDTQLVPVARDLIKVPKTWMSNGFVSYIQEPVFHDKGLGYQGFDPTYHFISPSTTTSGQSIYNPTVYEELLDVYYNPSNRQSGPEMFSVIVAKDVYTGDTIYLLDPSYFLAYRYPLKYMQYQGYCPTPGQTWNYWNSPISPLIYDCFQISTSQLKSIMGAPQYGSMDSIKYPIWEHYCGWNTNFEKPIFTTLSIYANIDYTQYPQYWKDSSITVDTVVLDPIANIYRTMQCAWSFKVPRYEYRLQETPDSICLEYDPSAGWYKVACDAGPTTTLITEKFVLDRVDTIRHINTYLDSIQFTIIDTCTEVDPPIDPPIDPSIDPSIPGASGAWIRTPNGNIIKVEDIITFRMNNGSGPQPFIDTVGRTIYFPWPSHIDGPDSVTINGKKSNIFSGLVTEEQLKIWLYSLYRMQVFEGSCIKIKEDTYGRFISLVDTCTKDIIEIDARDYAGDWVFKAGNCIDISVSPGGNYITYDTVNVPPDTIGSGYIYFINPLGQVDSVPSEPLLRVGYSYIEQVHHNVKDTITWINTCVGGGGSIILEGISASAIDLEGNGIVISTQDSTIYFGISPSILDSLAKAYDSLGTHRWLIDSLVNNPSRTFIKSVSNQLLIDSTGALYSLNLNLPKQQDSTWIGLWSATNGWEYSTNLPSSVGNSYKFSKFGFNPVTSTGINIDVEPGVGDSALIYTIWLNKDSSGIQQIIGYSNTDPVEYVDSAAVKVWLSTDVGLRIRHVYDSYGAKDSIAYVWSLDWGRLQDSVIAWANASIRSYVTNTDGSISIDSAGTTYDISVKMSSFAEDLYMSQFNANHAFTSGDDSVVLRTDLSGHYAIIPPNTDSFLRGVTIATQYSGTTYKSKYAGFYDMPIVSSDSTFYFRLRRMNTGGGYAYYVTAYKISRNDAYRVTVTSTFGDMVAMALIDFVSGGDNVFNPTANQYTYILAAIKQTRLRN